MTRSSANWQCKPGGFDALHTKRGTFRASPESILDIPQLLPQTFDKLPARFRLRPYRSKTQRSGRDICHFYLDDYRFESVWNRPTPAIEHVRRYWATLSPDFSIYHDWPLAVQIWNTYRARWTARYWQHHGINVIPTVNWAGTESIAFCFDGIPRGQIVSIAMPDMRREQVVERFTEGFHAMLEMLDPRLLLVYGRIPDPLRLVDLVEVTPDWERLRAI